MIKVNLVGKKRREKSSRNWILIVVVSFFTAFALYFLGASLYVVIRMYLINAEIKKVDDEAVEISSRISANKEFLSNYVLSKYILDKVDSLQKGRFRYKDYLDQIARFIPASAVLKNVDFAFKGWVAVSVSLPGINPLKELQSSLEDSTKLAQSEFSSVFSESVASDNIGNYEAKLFFEIKANGGK